MLIKSDSQDICLQKCAFSKKKKIIGRFITSPTLLLHVHTFIRKGHKHDMQMRMALHDSCSEDTHILGSQLCVHLSPLWSILNKTGTKYIHIYIYTHTHSLKLNHNTYSNYIFAHILVHTIHANHRIIKYSHNIYVQSRTKIKNRTIKSSTPR